MKNNDKQETVRYNEKESLDQKQGKENRNMSDLQRYTEAQKQDFDLALEEVRSGRKRSHWMWYIFPQIRGLGFSGMSAYYGHPESEGSRRFSERSLLGRNLRTICPGPCWNWDTDDPHRIFGSRTI